MFPRDLKFLGLSEVRIFEGDEEAEDVIVEEVKVWKNLIIAQMATLEEGE